MSHATLSAPLYMAQRAADALAAMLDPVCDRVRVAGSVRRGVEVVNDLELVVIPKVELDASESLFPVRVNLLERFFERVSDGRVEGVRRPVKRAADGRSPAWGKRYKRLLVFDHGRWFAADVFIVTPETWGAQLVIRTGPAGFSKLLVTSRVHGGAMPAAWRLASGQLWTFGSQIETPTEGSFFASLELPYWSPRERSERKFRKYAAERGWG